MSKGTRWKNKEDLILVETLTEHVAKGVNIHEVFPIVSDRLGDSRTPQACYSRWHVYLEPVYGGAIKLAMEKQKEHANLTVSSFMYKPTAPETTEVKAAQDVITYLQNLDSKYQHMEKEHEVLLEELEKTWQETESLKMQLGVLKQVEEQYIKIKSIASKLEKVCV